MINLRYHIVSITAVFLALGIGVALGSTLIERGLLDNLNDRLDEQAERLDRTDGENARLREHLDMVREVEDRLAVEGAALFQGHVPDVPVLVLTVQGTDEELVDQTRRSLTAGGASVSGVLSFTSRWESLSREEVAELAELTGRTLERGDETREEVVADLGIELLGAAAAPPASEVEAEGDVEGETGAETDPGDGPADAPIPPDESDGGDAEAAPESPDADDGAPDVATDAPDTPATPLVEGLVERGYLEFRPDGASRPLASFATRYVLVVDQEPAMDHELLLLGLVEGMADEVPSPLLLAEARPEVDPAVPPDAREGAEDDDEDAPDSLVTIVREDEDLAAAVTTTDAARRFLGQAAIVLGVADLVGDDVRVGHYGTGPNASSLLPPITDEG